MRVLAGVGLLALVGCGGSAQLVLKSPAVDKCENAALKGCPEIVDGVLMYVEGDDKNGAVAKIKKGVAKNSPEQVREFAQSLKALTELPGAKSFAKPINDVCALLEGAGGSEESQKAKTSPGVAVASSGAGLADYAPVLADLRGGTVFPSVSPKAGACPVVAPLDKDPSPTLGTCTRVSLGPLLVSNIHATGGCPYDMFVMAGTKFDGDGWYMLIPANGSVSVDGGLLSVADGDFLTVGARVPSGGTGKFDAHCAVTWAGKKAK